MAQYRHKAIAELAHQLKLSPVRLRLKQFDAAEYLVDLIEPDKTYPYEFVCHQLTGYRPKSNLQYKAIPGATLIEDLVHLVEDLSAATPLPVGAMRTPCWTSEELGQRLKVSTKTICRWRRRGLISRKLRYPDGTVRTAFTERVIRRFVSRHADLVRRGAAFKQLTEAEKQQMVDRAREILSQRRLRLHELSQLIAGEMGRAVETVRYTLRRWDHAHPNEALFGTDDQPAVRAELQAIYDAVQAGEAVKAVAARLGRSVESIQSVVREVRARRLKAAEIAFVYNPEFESPAADEVILTTPGAAADSAAESRPARVPRHLPAYLQELYRVPLLAPEQERDIFRRYNYLKFKAHQLRGRINPLAATDAQLDEVEQYLARAEETKSQILRANLRLVVSIARRHVGKLPHFFEIVSDGNLALMRAVEKFDYARGFKFSTYASWAVMRNYARTVPEQMYQSARLVTGLDEMLAAAPDRGEAPRDSIVEAARHLVAKGLALLNDRERDIVSRHYGLGRDGQSMTLDQIGQQFGVTKERIRQIERRALSKIRASLRQEHVQFVRE